MKQVENNLNKSQDTSLKLNKAKNLSDSVVNAFPSTSYLSFRYESKRLLNRHELPHYLQV